MCNDSEIKITFIENEPANTIINFLNEWRNRVEDFNKNPNNNNDISYKGAENFLKNFGFTDIVKHDDGFEGTLGNYRYFGIRLSVLPPQLDLNYKSYEAINDKS